MSRWNNLFDKLQTKEQMQETVSILESINTEGMTPQDLSEYSRLLKLARICLTRMVNLDPELISVNYFANLQTWLTETQNQIKAFIKNRNIGHLQNANTNIDQIINVLSPNETKLNHKDIKSIVDANSIFQQKIVEELENVRRKGEEARTELKSLTDAIGQNKNRLDEYNQNIQQQKNRLDQAIAEFQKQFSEAQEKRTKEFSDFSKKSSDRFSSLEKHFEAKFIEASEKRRIEHEAYLESIHNISNKHLEFLHARETEVNKIFGAIGTTAFAGNFKTTADTEADAANLFRWIALGLMTAMIAVGGYAFYYSIGHETDWRVFAFRLGTVIVLAVPALYAANESSKHRERERLNRKIHLELASLDAYLVLLPEAERNKIKGNLTEKFFGVHSQEANADEVTQKDLFSVLTTVLNNLTKGK
jgi:hypothetical protein